MNAGWLILASWKTTIDKERKAFSVNIAIGLHAEILLKKMGYREKQQPK